MDVLEGNVPWKVPLRISEVGLCREAYHWMSFSDSRWISSLEDHGWKVIKLSDKDVPLWKVVLEGLIYHRLFERIEPLSTTQKPCCCFFEFEIVPGTSLVIEDFDGGGSC